MELSERIAREAVVEWIEHELDDSLSNDESVFSIAQRKDLIERIAEKFAPLLAAQSQWRSIESAPRDGTSVLLVWDWDSGIHTGRSVVQASWHCRKHAHSSQHHDCPNESDCDMGWDHYAGEFPYWQPLPPPPSAAHTSADDELVAAVALCDCNGWPHTENCALVRRARDAAAQQVAGEVRQSHSAMCCRDIATRHEGCGSWCMYCVACSKPQTGSLNTAAPSDETLDAEARSVVAIHETCGLPHPRWQSCREAARVQKEKA